MVLSTILLLGMLGAAPASARHAPESFAFLLGTDFLCDLDPVAGCPDLAAAPSGDTIQLSGSGTFSVHAKTASGGGEWTHLAPDGSSVGGGTWEATGLISFASYGSGSAQDLPPETWGGKALLAVRLVVPEAGIEAPAMIWVTCTLGNKIPSSATEGIRVLAAPTPFGGINFNQEAGGLTVFLNMDS